MNVGFVGLGRMGGGMVGRLLAKGHAVRVHDRDPAQMDRMAALGAVPTRDLAELCEGCAVVITMLPSDEILEAVATGPGGLTSVLPEGAVHMLSGTHGVMAVERLNAAHKAAGQVLVTCTVLGRPDRAAEGKLGLIPAGPQAAVDALAPVFEALGERVFPAGEDPLSAVATKIANNFVLGCAIEAMGEGMALARKYGVDPKLFYEVLTSGLFDCLAYRAYGDVIAKEDWGRVGATATIGLKDAELTREASYRVDLPMPSLNVWRDHLISARGRGEKDLDWSVMAREQFRRGGLE